MLIPLKKLKRSWENFFLGQTYQLSEYYGKYPLYENLWLLNEKLPEIACKSLILFYQLWLTRVQLLR